MTNVSIVHMPNCRFLIIYNFFQTMTNYFLNICLPPRRLAFWGNRFAALHRWSHGIRYTNSQLIQQSTPPGYTFVGVDPEITTSRNPHRWNARFTRNDGTYDCDCVYIVAIKKAFKKYCPAGSEISYIRIRRVPNSNEIIVEYLVNCYCTNVPRRRKRSNFFWKSLL